MRECTIYSKNTWSGIKPGNSTFFKHPLKSLVFFSFINFPLEKFIDINVRFTQKINSRSPFAGKLIGNFIKPDHRFEVGLRHNQFLSVIINFLDPDNMPDFPVEPEPVDIIGIQRYCPDIFYFGIIVNSSGLTIIVAINEGVGNLSQERFFCSKDRPCYSIYFILLKNNGGCPHLFSFIPHLSLDSQEPFLRKHIIRDFSQTLERELRNQLSFN